MPLLTILISQVHVIISSVHKAPAAKVLLLPTFVGIGRIADPPFIIPDSLDEHEDSTDIVSEATMLIIKMINESRSRAELLKDESTDYMVCCQLVFWHPDVD